MSHIKYAFVVVIKYNGYTEYYIMPNVSNVSNINTKH